MHTSRHQQNNSRVLQHLLVHPIAKHYALRTGQDRDDLIQVGRLGLIKAANRFIQRGTTHSQPSQTPISEVQSFITSEIGSHLNGCRVVLRSVGFNSAAATENLPLKMSNAAMYASKSTWVARMKTFQTESTAPEAIDQKERARAVKQRFVRCPMW